MGVIEHWHGNPQRLSALVQTLQDAIRTLQTERPREINQSSQKAARRTLLQQQSGDTALADLRLERILAGNDLTDISSLALGLHRARSVGRIVIRHHGRLAGYATGFLVAPGVLMTNHHVFPDATRVRESLLQLNYERTMFGDETEPVSFALSTTVPPIIDRALDVAIVAVEPESKDRQPLQQFGWLTLDPQPGKAFVGEYLTIIQHPAGERKQICVRENKLLKYAEHEPFLWYQTDTVGGSSGSPVFNTTWDVVALHHQSVPRVTSRGGKLLPLTKEGRVWTPDMGDQAIDWIANEGVRVSSILQLLTQQYAGHPLARAILRRDPPPTAAPSTPSNNESRPHADSRGGIQVTQQPDGRTTILVPVEIDVRLNTARLTAPGATPGVPSDRPTANDPDSHTTRQITAPHSAHSDHAPGNSWSAVAVTEKVEIDTSNYDRRNGYQPDFPGGGIKVPLPRVVGRKFGKPLKLKNGRTELKYWNYSVIMNADRGLAFFSAANVRPKAQLGKRDGGNFIRDKRVDEVSKAAQIGETFYGRQSSFESDHRDTNPFDRGHLTRREDLQWGQTLEEAKRNGDDSFHFTNCAPQHFAFNQLNDASGLWNRLEVLAIRGLTDAPNLCLINGPVFDAPDSERNGNQILRLRLDGTRRPDPKFGGVAIPRMYFKVIAWQQKSQLQARAFVVSQEVLLEDDTRIRQESLTQLTADEIAIYEVRLRDLEKLTGLRFGLTDTPSIRPTESLDASTPQRRIQSDTDL